MPSPGQVRQAIADYLLQSFSVADVKGMQLAAPRKHIGQTFGDTTAWLICARNQNEVTAFLMLRGKILYAERNNSRAREVYCDDAKYSSAL
jgi:hypothetical protein